MVDWLVVWGVTQAVGFVFKPILEDLAKDAAKDWAKDLLKSIPNNLLQQLKKEDIEVAAGKALKEFFQLTQDELENADQEEAELKQYINALKQFINNKSVQEILGSPFKPDCEVLDSQVLVNTWAALNLPLLPQDFNWDRIAKRYLKKVKAIIRESDKLRSLLDSQNLEAAKHSLKQIAGLTTDFDLRQYQEAIKERYGNLKLDSLDSTGYAYNDLKLWRMFITPNVREIREFLPQFHEIPKEHQKSLGENNELEVNLEELERYKRVYLEQPIQPILDIINDKQTYKYVVILGDPGSGKSTLLQFLALNWAESPLNYAISRPIPLLIELRTYIRNRDEGHCKNFLEFFHQSPGSICHLNQLQLHEQLKAGKALVMFDGLDEVFVPGKREDLIIDIHRFTNQYPHIQVIVTSRVVDYKPHRLRDAEFDHFMLQDLESEQIQDFINRWHELTFKNEVERVRKKERLQLAIDTSKSIRELAGNPLLLTMMAILNRNQELPRNRPELYHQASRLLLHQWDVEEKVLEHPKMSSLSIDYKDKQAILRQLAYHMQANEKGLSGNLISEDDLVNIITDYLKSIEVNDARTVARLMKDQLRSRNFILCFVGADYYAFVHRSFLEYFCAWEFVWQFKEKQTFAINHIIEIFGEHWQDESWHEVLRLITAMIEAKFLAEIIDYLIAQNGEAQKFLNIFLAAECLAEVRNRNAIAPTASQLLSKLKELTKYDLNYHYAPLDKEARLVCEIRTKAVNAIATTWKDAPETLTWLKSCTQFDHNSSVRQAALHALVQVAKNHPDTLPWLKSLVQSDKLPDVRRAAMQKLAQGWKDNPDTLPLIQSLAQDNKNPLIRRAGVQELAQTWKDHLDTLTILKFRAQFDEDAVVRETAVQELARGWKNHPDTLPILQSGAQSDADAVVREAAVRELAQGWKDAPETLIILKSCAQKDDNSYLRRIIIQKLAKGWQDQPDMFEFLQTLAVNDPFEREYDFQDNPRLTALEAIIEYYFEHPQTLELLQDRVKQDPDKKVRKFAKDKLLELDSKSQ